MIFLPVTSWTSKETVNKGKGLFATKPITKGTIIGDYIGKVLRPEDAIVDENNFYLLYYHDRAAILPDITKAGIHLLNHSCVPNCMLYIYKGHTLAFALRDIAANEELTIHYLLAPKDKFCNPCEHICHCGSELCTGTMHLSKATYLAWRIFSEAQAKQTKRARIRYGKDLPLLSSYPERISEEYIQKVTRLFS